MLLNTEEVVLHRLRIAAEQVAHVQTQRLVNHQALIVAPLRPIVERSVDNQVLQMEDNSW